MVTGFGIGGHDGIGVSVAQAEGREQGRVLGVVKLVEDHVAVNAVSLGLGVGHDVGNLEIAELHALDGVAVGLLAVAKVVDGAVVHGGFQGSVLDAGGDVGLQHGGHGVVGVGPGQVVLVDVDLAGSGEVDGGVRDSRRADADGQREEDGDGHDGRQDTLDFHTFSSFLLFGL